MAFHGISGHGPARFRNANSVESILTPAKYKTGNVIYPYSEAKQEKSASAAH